MKGCNIDIQLKVGSSGISKVIDAYGHVDIEGAIDLTVSEICSRVVLELMYLSYTKHVVSDGKGVLTNRTDGKKMIIRTGRNLIFLSAHHTNGSMGIVSSTSV